MSLAGRLKRIEEKLSVGKELNRTTIVVDADEALLGPVKEWLTFQEQLQEEPPDSQVVIFIAAAEAEIGARAKQ